MATRSTIAIMHGDRVKSVYCHWDGYPAGVGATLLRHYSSSPKVNNLIALGDISSLGEEIGEKHEFSRLDSTLSSEEYEALYGKMTTFYTRDRGEDTPFHSHSSVQEWLAERGEQWCEYAYLYDTAAQTWRCYDPRAGVGVHNWKLEALNEEQEA
jgi:hypothetical protein